MTSKCDGLESRVGNSPMNNQLWNTARTTTTLPSTVTEFPVERGISRNCTSLM